jgi:hypothetical protein
MKVDNGVGGPQRGGEAGEVQIDTWPPFESVSLMEIQLYVHYPGRSISSKPPVENPGSLRDN